MATVSQKPPSALDYERAAHAYLRGLPLEHFMEATTQATQRKITLESLDLLHARRPDVQVFNELLVQYPLPGQRRPGQVVPDNMVVLCDEPTKAKTSFNVSLEPAPPFWVLEYVSRSNPRKDYVDNREKYERQLKVRYYLRFDPELQDLTLYHHTGKRYVAAKANARGRCRISELDLEIGLRDGWVRFWHFGKLLPLPAELQRDLDQAAQAAAEAGRRAESEARRADAEARRADAEAHRADAEARRAADEARRADELQRRLEASQRDLAQLRAQSRVSQVPRNHGPRTDK